MYKKIYMPNDTMKLYWCKHPATYRVACGFRGNDKCGRCLIKYADNVLSCNKSMHIYTSLKKYNCKDCKNRFLCLTSE
jgi:hypothetical protein